MEIRSLLRSARVINSTFIANPSYQQFQKQVLAGKHSVFAAGINTMVSGRIEDSGHAMAVEGVARFGPKGQGVKFSYLYVFDGWNDKVFIDYSFTGYTRKHGIFFHD
ncbi:MAG: hypothetical protein E7001_04350 [Coriobacteriaceae bacterium]|nr:hypothetical protein [Coriobacteriaceae bacterium]